MRVTRYGTLTPNIGSVTCASCSQQFAADGLFCPKCGTAKARNFDGDPVIGSRVGERFLILDRIGHGGSGTIYRAEHITLRRKVAVKVLHDELSRDDLAIERFRREATTVGEIDNDHIVQIHDFGRMADGRLYLAMELLEGETLEEVLQREKRLGVEQAVDVLIQLGEALMEAHAMGYIHRDLRPRNVYLAVRRGRANFVKLLDFGLAKLVEKEGEAASTSLGMTFGEPKYMSPEQARGEPVDRRGDIYSLGCIAYEMIVGEPPFSGGRVFDILTRHVEATPVPPRQRRDDIPEWLDVTIMSMLAKNPEERFTTVFRLVEALRDGLKTGTAMPSERARRRETTLPPAVSREIERFRVRQLEREAEAESADDASPTSQQEVGDAPVTPSAESARASGEPNWARTVPAGLVRAASESSSDDGSGEAAAVDDEPHAPDLADRDQDDEPQGVGDSDLQKTFQRPRGKRESGGLHGLKSAKDSVAGLSAAWFADGEVRSGNDDDELDEKFRAKLDKARPAIAPPSRSGLIGDTQEMYFEAKRRPLALIAAIVLGLVVIVVAAVALWPSSTRSDRPTAELTPPDAALPAPPIVAPPIDAGVAAAVLAPDAASAAASATPTRTAAKRRPAHSRPRKDRPRKDRPRKDRPRDKPRDPYAQPRTPPDAAAKPTGPTPEERAKAVYFVRLGKAALRGADILGAATHFNKARQLDPRNINAVIGLGEVALSQGSYSAAIRHFSRAARAWSGSSNVHRLLGDAYLGAGKTSKAAASYKRALQLNPDNARARNGYNEATGQR